MKHFNSNASALRSLGAVILALVSVGFFPTYRATAAVRQEPQEHQKNWVEAADHGLRLEFENLDVHEALRKVFAFTRRKLDLDPHVQGTVTVSLKDVTLGTALENITRQVGAQARQDLDAVRVFPRPTGHTARVILPVTAALPTKVGQFVNGTGVSEGPLDITCLHSPVRTVVQMIFERSHASYSIDLDVEGQVTLTANHVTYDAALQAVLSQVGATYRVENGKYIITPVPSH